jgi:VWFA-related protein
MKPHSAILILAALLLHAQQPPPAAEQRFPDSGLKISVTTKLVVVNVEVRDKNGRPIEGLKPQDFTITEDEKPQKLSVFEFQRLETQALPPEPATTGPTEVRIARVEPKRNITPSNPGQVRFKDRRLLVLFFDLSSMPPEDQIRAQKAAMKFLDTQITPADMVAVMTFSTRLNVVEDFTSDRDKLRADIKALHIGEASELADLAATGEDSTTDNGSAFTADDTEFNVFNTDRKLSALEDATRMLASLPEKKAVVYFSSGVSKTGTENQSQIRSTTNAAVKANVSFYPIDARGLVASAPGGDARSGSARGSGMYSGSAQTSARQSMNDSQETLTTLAADTGGKALLDNNDLSMGIQQAQKDVASYYILGYYTSNPATDGKFRKIRVKLNQAQHQQAKLNYRTGYFADKEFKNFTAGEKERQLEEAIMLGDPLTDLPLALELNYFKMGKSTYFVPVAVKIPGSAIETLKKSGGEQAELDFIAQVRDSAGKLVGTVRDGLPLKLKGEGAGGLAKKNLEYDSGFTLAPGNYTIKFLARENVTGHMGTFETKFTVPDLAAQSPWLHTSSVVWANQRENMAAALGTAEKSKKLLAAHPLIQDGQKLIPSITRVYRTSQNLYVYLEVYDAGLAGGAKTPDVLASLSFFRGSTRTFQSEAIRIQTQSSSRQHTVPVRFEVPLASLKPGRYTCQVNLIDNVAQKFAFARAPLLLMQ